MSRADPRPSDSRLFEQVLAAIDAGTRTDPTALAKVINASEADIRGALEALRQYDDLVAAERRARRISSPQSAPPLPPSPALAPGTRLGSFVIDAVLGSGGMGTVYRARQTTLGDRAVALKVLPRLLVSRDPKFAERFRREATLAATIDHPSIAKIHLLEEVGGDLCFAMQLVEGPTLHDALLRLAGDRAGKQFATSPEHVRRCVHLARMLADALSTIHEHGLVHRDVKPANVLLEAAPGGDADPLLSRPVLVDFGLLRPIGDTELTGTNTALGTPAYASPDAALGRDLDARADVFSLAATLYDLLTLTLPSSRTTASAGLPDPRTINPTIDGRLAAILAMALQEKKALRYEHAGALRDELDRYLRGEPVHALPTSAFGRLRLWVRRDRPRALGIAAASVIAIVALAVLVLAGGWVWRTNRMAELASEDERAGRLGGAFAWHAALAREPGASMLFWLDEVRQRGKKHWSDGGTLHAAVKHLQAAEDALDRGPVSATFAEYEFERAHDRLVEVLLDERHHPVAEAIHALYRSELQRKEPEVRVRIALESFADYLLVTKAPQPLPDDLFALVRNVALGEGDWQHETREAAMSVLATTRTPAAFAALVDALNGDLTEPVAAIAQAGAYHVYRWLHRDDRAAHATLRPPLLERWARGVERQATLYDPAWASAVAQHLAWWERMPEPPFTQRGSLALSTFMREVVADWQRQHATSWAVGTAEILGPRDPNSAEHPYHAYMQSSGRGAIDYEDQIWLPPAAGYAPVPLAAASRDPSPTWNGLRFEGGGDPRERLGGTVRAGWYAAASVHNWEKNTSPPYLKLDRPGHSALQLTTDVPRDASGLQVRVAHMVGARSILRRGGVVVYQLRVVGTDWRQQSAIDANQAVADKLSVATVDRHVFAGRDQIDIALEYLHGNTTYRVSTIELVWSFPPR